MSNPHGRSLEIPRGWGTLKAKLLEGKHEAKLKFPWKGGGGVGELEGAKKNFRGGSMDIFWNYKLQYPLRGGDWPLMGRLKMQWKLGLKMQLVGVGPILRVVFSSEIHACAGKWAPRSRRTSNLWCLSSWFVSSQESIFAHACISPVSPKLETTRSLHVGRMTTEHLLSSVHLWEPSITCG